MFALPTVHCATLLCSETGEGQAVAGFTYVHSPGMVASIQRWEPTRQDSAGGQVLCSAPVHGWVHTWQAHMMPLTPSNLLACNLDAT
jgi:hypothetical protein